MDILKTLADIGLPGWFIIAAATVFILYQFGLLKWLTGWLSDRQEHAQKIEDKQANFERLQQSWQSERLATILEENESFIRERVWGKLDKIDKAIEERLYRLEMTLAQLRDTLAIIGREIYELKRLISKNKFDSPTNKWDSPTDKDNNHD